MINAFLGRNCLLAFFGLAEASRACFSVLTFGRGAEATEGFSSVAGVTVCADVSFFVAGVSLTSLLVISSCLADASFTSLLDFATFLNLEVLDFLATGCGGDAIVMVSCCSLGCWLFCS